MESFRCGSSSGSLRASFSLGVFDVGIHAEQLVPPLSPRQGHSLTHDGWANPVRWQDIYGNFSQLQPDIPVLWGTVEDSVDRMNEIGIKPLGTNLPLHIHTHTPFQLYAHPSRSVSSLRGQPSVAYATRSSAQIVEET